MARKGADPPGLKEGGVGSDIIFSERRGQSQKPEEIYQLIEELVPNGEDLLLVGCSPGWVAVVARHVPRPPPIGLAIS